MLIKPSLYAIFLLIFFAILIPGRFVYAGENFHEKLLQDSDKQAGGAYVRTRFLKNMKKPFSPNNARKKYFY